MSISNRAIKRLREVVRTPEVDGTRYRIVRHIGDGGMGSVFEAEDRILQRRVALKVVQPEEAYLSEQSAARLVAEAQILASLEHPGIVPVHDAGVLPDGQMFYTMKFVQGESLSVFAANASLAEALTVFQKVCDTTAFAHAHGVIHRDLKPDNIMVGAYGEVLVMDWGVAKILGSDPELEGTVVGTPRYMAPEQQRGESESIDPRADVFGLGAVLGFLLDATRSRSRPLRSVAGRACAEDPAGRYANAGELSAEIRRYLDGEPLLAHRERLSERAARVIAHNKTAFALVLAYLLMRVVVFFLLHR